MSVRANYSIGSFSQSAAVSRGFGKVCETFGRTPVTRTGWVGTMVTTPQKQPSNICRDASRVQIADPCCRLYIGIQRQTDGTGTVIRSGPEPDKNWGVWGVERGLGRDGQNMAELNGIGLKCE